MPEVRHHTASKGRISGLEFQDESPDDSVLNMSPTLGIGATSRSMVDTGSGLSQIPEISTPTSLPETKTGSAAEITPSLPPHYSSQTLWTASANESDEAETETAETETNDQVVDSEHHDPKEIDANTELTGHGNSLFPSEIK
jgi:hypothetical protein